MRFHEVDWFSKYKTPDVYFRYLNDIFCVFGSATEAGEFFSHLNSMQPALRFTLEKETNSSLPFLDVLVCLETFAFLTTVYRKPAFSGLYIRRDSFCRKKRKINLIKTLTHLPLMICFESKLDNQVKFISGTFCNNGFPEYIVRWVIRDKISDFSKIKPVSVQRWLVYLRLPWLGDIRDKFANQISACYFLPTWVWSSACRLFRHLVEKTFSLQKIVVLWHYLLRVFADYNTSGEPINVWIQELNNMYPQKYG